MGKSCFAHQVAKLEKYFLFPTAKCQFLVSNQDDNLAAIHKE